MVVLSENYSLRTFKMAMAYSRSNLVSGLFLRAVLVSVVMISSVQGDTTINLLNMCTQDLTTCQTSNNGTIACYVLDANGGSYSLDVGSTWTGGTIWAFPARSGTNTTIGNDAKPQANLAEFMINSNGEDYYDISVVNAYNLGMQIIVPSTVVGTPSGTMCASITCSISNITSFCQAPNTLTGAPGEGCYNTDGSGTTPTRGTEAFANACPEAYSYFMDDDNHVYGCPTTSNYQVKWCPS